MTMGARGEYDLRLKKYCKKYNDVEGKDYIASKLYYFDKICSLLVDYMKKFIKSKQYDVDTYENVEESDVESDCEDTIMKYIHFDTMTDVFDYVINKIDVSLLEIIRFIIKEEYVNNECIDFILDDDRVHSSLTNVDINNIIPLITDSYKNYDCEMQLIESYGDRLDYNTLITALECESISLIKYLIYDREMYLKGDIKKVLHLAVDTDNKDIIHIITSKLVNDGHI